jgi:hypothetical protein
MISGMIGIAVFLDDSSLFDHALQFWTERVPAYFYSHSQVLSEQPRECV